MLLKILKHSLFIVKGVDGATPTSIINKLVKDFLEMEEVKAVIAEQSKDKKKEQVIQKKKDMIAKLQAEIVEMEKGMLQNANSSKSPSLKVEKIGRNHENL